MVSIGTILYLSRSDRKFYRSLAFGVRRGYVSARFYQFSDFNIADMSLVIGVLLIFIYALVDDEVKGK